MKFALDHVVVAVKDLARAIEDYRARGFTVTAGGRHPPPRTSSNALVAFEDGAYLELITWEPPNPAERWSNLLQEHGAGIVDFALVPANLPLAIAEAEARGLHLNGPVDGARLRPDGVEVRWQTGRQGTFDLPFLCGDVTPRELRVPAGDARRHANGARGVVEVTVAVNDLAVSVGRYAALLGARPGVSGNEASIVVGGTTLRLIETPAAREGARSMAIARRQGDPLQLDGVAMDPAG